MIQNKTHQPGNLIHYRHRDWMVLPSDEADLLKIKYDYPQSDL